jgi:transposase
MNYVGIDHHRQYSHLTVMDQTGQVLRSGRVANLQSEIERFLEGLEAMEAVIETGRSSYTMVDVLEEMGVAVKIAHPNEVKSIARAKIKTDKRDSEVLAHLLRMNMIPEVYRRSQENRQAQRVLRRRSFYVSAMTATEESGLCVSRAAERGDPGGCGAGGQHLFRKRTEGALGAGFGAEREEAVGGAPEDLSSPRDKDRGVEGICGEAL